MRMYDLIVKKRNGGELNEEEIRFFIENYTNGQIPDYQVSALMMAIYFQKMTERETLALTMAMAESGDMLDLSGISGVKVDKHSTGGVGDKTTLALAPMVAACGVPVAKMSGRGLGHTGGTIDKLESFPGFSTGIPIGQFIENVNTHGISVMGQTADLAPADKKLYALRDVTGTVISVPLIASSVMSKKLAAGAQIIELDVKCGDGAFMKTPEDAEILADMMIRLGKACGKKVSAMITDMNEPLGMAIGNMLEVKEAVETLRGRGPKDLTELVLTGGASILVNADIALDMDDGRRKMSEVIADGTAFEKFKAMVKAQNGDVAQIENLDMFPEASFITPVKSEKTGFVCAERAWELGRLAMEIGAGRADKEDVIEPEVGIVLEKKTGDFVEKGDVLAWVHHNRPLENGWKERMYAAFDIKDERVSGKQLIYKIM